MFLLKLANREELTCITDDDILQVVRGRHRHRIPNPETSPPGIGRHEKATNNEIENRELSESKRDRIGLDPVQYKHVPFGLLSPIITLHLSHNQITAVRLFFRWVPLCPLPYRERWPPRRDGTQRFSGRDGSPRRLTAAERIVAALLLFSRLAVVLLLKIGTVICTLRELS
ncbi:hypothetical protein GW17_00034181 [Ensete ventricosum]|nr:hypothetical protein GW17_00034181 [Ensete ventricosum]